MKRSHRAHGFGAFAVAAPADLSIAAEDVNDGFLVAVVCTELVVCGWAIITPPQIWEELERSLLMQRGAECRRIAGVLRLRSR